MKPHEAVTGDRLDLATSLGYRRQMASGPGSTESISAQQLGWIVAGLHGLGTDVPAILARAGIDEARLGEADARFEPALEFALWEASLEVTGDPCLGLHMARALRPGSLGTVDYMLRHGANLRATLKRAQQFARLVDPRFRVEFHEGPDGDWLRVLRDGGFPQPDVECLFATTAAVTGTKLPGHPLTEVRFVHQRIGPLATYAEFFSCPVVFGSEHNELLFGPGALGAPMRRVDPALGQVLEEHASKMLDELPYTDPFLQTARRALMAELGSGGPSLDILADRLHVSTRTLRRRLMEHGTSYKVMLDALRKELGCRYVQHSDHGLEEVASLLGYQDSRTFYRNFKRWTGMTPAAYRKQGREQAK